jgi:hypothetical protein
VHGGVSVPERVLPLCHRILRVLLLVLRAERVWSGAVVEDRDVPPAAGVRERAPGVLGDAPREPAAGREGIVAAEEGVSVAALQKLKVWEFPFRRRRVQ